MFDITIIWYLVFVYLMGIGFYWNNYILEGVSRGPAWHYITGVLLSPITIPINIGALLLRKLK